MIKRFARFFSFGPRRVEDMVTYPEGRRIYRDFHSLRREQMDPDALKVLNRLNRHGYRTYMVGGCVRDLLVGKRPKDFDLVTNATPAQIRKIFTNSRSIGRRFKIVHVFFRGGKIIEVSTFRSLPDHRLGRDKKKDLDYMMKRDNEFGTPIEDAARRDFTINALFFDPRNESIIDYVGGFDDIHQGRISVIGDPEISFQEDPVRMLRAAKFSALTGFEMDPACIKAIKKNREEIQKASPARMLEEYYKIFRTGRSAEIFASLAETGLFRSLFPEASAASDARGARVESFYESAIGQRFQIADKMLHEREDLTVNVFLAIILLDLVYEIYNEDFEGNITNYVKNAVDPVAKRLNLPGKDRDRILQIFISQVRFGPGGRKKKNRPDLFTGKIFFFEAFMVFKIKSIADRNDEALQQAMFWEIGPRHKPPEPGKVITMFPQRRFSGNSSNSRISSSRKNAGTSPGKGKKKGGKKRSKKSREAGFDQNEREDLESQTDSDAIAPDEEFQDRMAFDQDRIIDDDPRDRP